MKYGPPVFVRFGVNRREQPITTKLLETVVARVDSCTRFTRARVLVAFIDYFLSKPFEYVKTVCVYIYNAATNLITFLLLGRYEIPEIARNTENVTVVAISSINKPWGNKPFSKIRRNRSVLRIENTFRLQRRRQIDCV